MLKVVPQGHQFHSISSPLHFIIQKDGFIQVVGIRDLYSKQEYRSCQGIHGCEEEKLKTTNNDQTH